MSTIVPEPGDAATDQAASAALEVVEAVPTVVEEQAPAQAAPVVVSEPAAVVLDATGRRPSTSRSPRR